MSLSWSDGEWTVGGIVEAGRRGGFPALATRGVGTRKDRDAPSRDAPLSGCTFEWMNGSGRHVN